MRGVNKVILIGNIGHEFKVRTTTADRSVTNLNIATNEKWTHRPTGEFRSHTEWHRVVLFGRLADIAGRLAQKGTTLYIEGRLRSRKRSEEDGSETDSTEIIADKMIVFTGDEDSEPRAETNDNARRGWPSTGSRKIQRNTPSGSSDSSDEEGVETFEETGF